MHVISIILVIALLSPFAICQTIENGWKEIKPLKTSKAAVEKILGHAEPDQSGYFGYQPGDEVFVQVNYSTEPCQADSVGRGKYAVPKDTVLGYNVRFRKSINLSDLKYRRQDYVRQTDPHSEGQFVLINRNGGVMITGETNGSDLVNVIYFTPSTADKEKFKC
jgi:hypothetical protein